MKLADVNALSVEEFEATFGDIAEHSKWVATKAFASKPFASCEELIAAFQAAVMNAGKPPQLALLNAHPDLATRAKLTTDSTREQQGVGLDSLSPQEFEIFNTLNHQYKEQNAFPFIFAVKGATKQQILQGFQTRIHNAKDVEFKTALEQVCRIIRFRLQDKVLP